MLLFSFFTNEQVEVPQRLAERNESVVLYLMGFIALSLLLVVLAKLYNQKSLRTVIVNLINPGNLETSLKENMRLRSFSSVALILNYFIVLSLGAYVYLTRMANITHWYALIFSLGFSFLLLILEIFGPVLISWFTGESSLMRKTITVTLSDYHFFGLLLAVFSLVWIKNPVYNEFMANSFLIILLLRLILRLLKNSIIVLTNGVSWYYLFLYFCTLEILPLFVAYYYLLQNFWS